MQCMSNDITECDSAVCSSLHGTQGQGCHLVFFDFLILKMPKNTKIFIWQPRWNMISPVIFAGALTIFAGALPPWARPGDGAGEVTSQNLWSRYDRHFVGITWHNVWS